MSGVETGAELKPEHQGKWVALLRGKETAEVVGVGESPLKAAGEAESKGYKDISLMLVTDFDKALAP